MRKTNDAAGGAVAPGDEFNYELVVQCSSLTEGCVGQTLVDVLPVGLDVTSLPASTSGRTVVYDKATRTLTITFLEKLDQPPGTTGLQAGSTENLSIGMRLPADSTIADGTTVENTATTDADNAAAKSSTSPVRVTVPLDVRPVATKSWKDGSALAGSGEATSVTLGVRNASSSTAKVTALQVTDDTPGTYEHFDFTGAALTRFPAGADTAQLLVCTKPPGGCADADYRPGAKVTAAGVLPLPAGVAAGDVTGVRVVFTDAAGAVLPYDATGGSVDLGMKLRDTERSSGAPIAPQQKLTVTNCATPGATDAGAGQVSGADACKPFDILPNTVQLLGSKAFFPDTDGNFKQDAGEYAVLGAHSPVSGTVNVKNTSAFAISEITITDPDTASPQNEFDKLDVANVRLRFPSRATTAHVLVRYDDGSTKAYDKTADAAIDVTAPGKRVTSVSVTYSGPGASIQPGTTAGLDLHGILNDRVTADDLPNGRSPGVYNCAGFTGSTTQPDGVGNATGTACKALEVQEPRVTGQGVKSVGQTSVPPGQPIPFTLTVTNNGNLPLPSPVITDPRVGPDGTPDPNFANLFASLQITSAAVAPADLAGKTTIEVYDPQTRTWVAYTGASAAVLARATGVRASLNGDLAPTKQLTLNLVTERRADAPDGVTIQNCFTTTATGLASTDPACAPSIQTGPADDSATLNKSISPGSLPNLVPGLPRQYADVKLTLRNTGNLSARQLTTTDEDPDFFDAVDLTKVSQVKFPTGANLVQIDALVNGAWVPGTPTSSKNPALPAGVDPATVTGIRATFTNSNGDYALTPCPATQACQGEVSFQVSPRPALRSDPGTRPSDHLADTATGGLETLLQPPGQPKAIPPANAALTLTEGSPQLDVRKTPDSTLSPGGKAPFNLKVTNTGTANVPDLVVKDLLPPGLEPASEDPTAYTITDVTVPDGTPPVPKPDMAFGYDPDGRIGMVTWNFGTTADGNPWVFAPGSTFTIQIQVQLAPGVTAGQVITNTMGATSSDDRLTCKAVSDVDGPFGSGRYCTDTARVTVKAGSAFTARKWVHGNDALGWYDPRSSSVVPVGTAPCPTATDAAGLLFTRYPCVALVNPGDQYKYLLRVTNSGTDPGTQVRIIDRFPVQGDTGVILPQGRGTEWDNRPTLATEPAQTKGPGALSVTYTNAEPICTADLNLNQGAAQCPAGAWDAPFGPGVVGAQLRVNFDTPLAPGKGFDVEFGMNTPLNVAQVSNPTVAWNSFAHAETTQRGNATNVLPPTEPLQVGVALGYGGLELVKAIGVNPAKLPLADTTFTFHATCQIHPVDRETQTVLDQDFEVSPNTPVTIPGLPGGADCRVWETDNGTHGGLTDHGPNNPIELTIKPGYGTPSVDTATITNDFPNGVLQLRKTVTGPGASYARDSFPVAVTCTFDGQPVPGFPKQVDLQPTKTLYTVDVPIGSHCSAAELDSGGATSVTYDPPGEAAGSGQVTIVPTEAADIGITNTYQAGSLQIRKSLAGAGSPELALGTTFRFGLSCLFDGRDITEDTVLSVTYDGTKDSLLSTVQGPFPIGTVCTVAEMGSGGADATPDPQTVTITAQDTTVDVPLTNTYSAGTVWVTKAVAGAGADQPWVTDAMFTVHVTCAIDPAAGIVYSRDILVPAGGEVQGLDGNGNVAKIPLGAHCWGEETGTGGATSSSVSPDSYQTGVVVTGENPDVLQRLDITATNTFDLGSLELHKVVDGAAAGFAAGRSFKAALTCTLDQGGDSPTTIVDAVPYTITADTPVTVAGLPVGASCWATETDTGGATSSSVDHATPDTALLVPATDTGAPVAITATNTFAAGELSVAKKVVNGPPGPYRFELSCTIDGAPVPLPAADAAFELTAGQARTIVVPIGATCTASEIDVPAGANVTYDDSDGTHDGTVTVHDTANVSATNTFHPTPPPTPSPTPSPSPSPSTSPAPSTGPAPSTSAPPSGGSVGGSLLPRTGGAPITIALLGIVVLGLGAVMIRVSRRRGR